MAAKKPPKPAPRARLRRAQVEDVVNIFKLSQRQMGAPADQAEATATVRYFIDLITDGHVVVADLSGRIMGAIGCERLGKGYNLVLLAIDAVYDSSGVDKALMKNLCGWAKKNDFKLRAAISEAQFKDKGHLVKDNGLVRTSTVWELGTAAAAPAPKEAEVEIVDEPVAETAEAVKVPDAPDAPWLNQDGSEGTDE